MSLKEGAVSWNARNVEYALSYNQMLGLSMRFVTISAVEPTGGCFRFWMRIHVRTRGKRVSIGRLKDSINSWNMTCLKWTLGLREREVRGQAPKETRNEGTPGTRLPRL
jgi:hypothetical protein